jgi:hypothetical protein
MFIVEMRTQSGTVCEPYETLAEAQRRVQVFPADSLVTLPLIFEILPDGSERLVRDDGKPLQWHRPADDAPPVPEEPLPVSEPLPGATIEHLPPPDEWPDIDDVVHEDELGC